MTNMQNLDLSLFCILQRDNSMGGWSNRDLSFSLVVTNLSSPQIQSGGTKLKFKFIVMVHNGGTCSLFSHDTMPTVSSG
jgi:hypothetical protein